MSIYDKASLVLIPSGTKTSKVYSQKPVNGDGDFTFSRSTAATRVNADGNIEKETQNLLLQSNSFDTTWSADVGASVTSGQTGYDGTNNAWLLSTNQAGSQLVQSKSVSGVHTLSVYAKAGTYDFCRVLILSGNTAFTDFNLANGTIGTSDADTIDATITSVGGGWYRLTLTAADSAITAVRLYAIVADNNITGTSGNILIQDAQLEQGLVARDYIETTTAAVEGGITDNVPRLDYTDSSCPALLLEPQRTNLFTHSEYFGDWTTFRSSISANEATSPEGLTNAYKLIQESGQTTSGGINKGVTTIDATTYTYTFFAKEAGYGWCYARLMGGANNYYAWFDLSNGVKGNVTNGATSSIEPYGNGWYRCSITFANSGTSAIPHIYIAEANSSASVSNPDGVKGINIYGATIEQGSYATSYIPTYGTSVTRNAEYGITNSIPSLFGSTEGSFYIELKSNYMEGIPLFLESSDNAGFNYATYLQLGTTSVTLAVYSGGASQVSISSSGYSSGDTLKVACAYKNNDFVMYVNGQLAGTDASGVISTNLNKYVIGRYPAAGTLFQYNGNVNQALLFKTRLSNEELAALTTI